ncbi:hypothetical protein FEM48_Zijuj05G0192100 [Ziziphus jujuba var. spinosa]|uniref:Uncharacterized protein n=1 Tax=Ziziphus jujuba var. spinosa TaxID=714518 RepID=A0A978VGM5_ZIZJJ|nr:hypothetical protein FEM48_Zijuj05G0192100 [Ziziphus jujuba var. spinosa]
MPHSRIEQLGDRFKNFENLKSVNLSSSEFLTKIPDLSTAPNIENLYLDHCTNLVEIHESIGSLIRLVTLDIQFCPNLRIFPSTLHAKYLRKLNFKSCSSLARLPNIVVEMKNLTVLCLSGFFQDVSNQNVLEH